MGRSVGYNDGERARTALLRHADAAWRRERLAPWLEGLAPYASVMVDEKAFMLVHAGFDPTVWDARTTVLLRQAGRFAGPPQVRRRRCRVWIENVVLGNRRSCEMGLLVGAETAKR